MNHKCFKCGITGDFNPIGVTSIYICDTCLKKLPEGCIPTNTRIVERF